MSYTKQELLALRMVFNVYLKHAANLNWFGERQDLIENFKKARRAVINRIVEQYYDDGEFVHLFDIMVILSFGQFDVDDSTNFENFNKAIKDWQSLKNNEKIVIDKQNEKIWKEVAKVTCGLPGSKKKFVKLNFWFKEMMFQIDKKND